MESNQFKSQTHNYKTLNWYRFKSTLQLLRIHTICKKKCFFFLFYSCLTLLYAQNYLIKRMFCFKWIKISNKYIRNHLLMIARALIFPTFYSYIKLYSKADITIHINLHRKCRKHFLIDKLLHNCVGMRWIFVKNI